MAEAFREMGFNVYDAVENFEYLGDKWINILKYGGTTEDFYEMYKDVDAVTDMPCFYFWKQLSEAFPDAKIVFSQRNTEDEWWRSMLSQIEAGDGLLFRIMPLFSPTMKRMNDFGFQMFKSVCGFEYDYGLFKKTRINEMMMRHTYRSHNAYVLHSAPKDQLLVYELKQGWGPLCEFLNVPIPDKPFPHKNKKGSINQEFMETHPVFIRMQKEMMITGSLMCCTLAYIGYKWITWPSNSPNMFSWATSSIVQQVKSIGIF